MNDRAGCGRDERSGCGFPTRSTGIGRPGAASPCCARPVRLSFVPSRRPSRGPDESMSVVIGVIREGRGCWSGGLPGPGGRGVGGTRAF